jgi:hypothetical protein
MDCTATVRKLKLMMSEQIISLATFCKYLTFLIDVCQNLLYNMLVIVKPTVQAVRSLHARSHTMNDVPSYIADCGETVLIDGQEGRAVIVDGLFLLSHAARLPKVIEHKGQRYHVRQMNVVGSLAEVAVEAAPDSSLPPTNARFDRYQRFVSAITRTLLWTNVWRAGS